MFMLGPYLRVSRYYNPSPSGKQSETTADCINQSIDIHRRKFEGRHMGQLTEIKQLIDKSHQARRIVSHHIYSLLKILIVGIHILNILKRRIKRTENRR